MIPIPKKTYDTCEEERVVIPAGRYLLEITDAEEQNAGEYVLVKYRTIYPNAGANGEERFYATEKALKRYAALCKRAGLQERGTDDSESMCFDPFDLVGIQFVVDLDVENKTSEKGREYQVNKWAFMGFWRADDPRVADFTRTLQTTRRPAAPATNGRQPVAAAVTDDEV